MATNANNSDTILPAAQPATNQQVENKATPSTDNLSSAENGTAGDPKLFFKIYDLPIGANPVKVMDGVSRDAESVDLRPQDENTLRIILDSRDEFTIHNQRLTISPNITLNSPADRLEFIDYHQPAIRDIINGNSAEWYISDALAIHKYNCTYTRKESTSRYEDSKVGFNVMRIDGGRYILLCQTHLWNGPRGTCEAGCNSAIVHWMLGIESALTSAQKNITGYNDPIASLERVLMEIMSVNYYLNWTFLQRWGPYNFAINSDWFRSRSVLPTDSMITASAKAVTVLRRIERSMTLLFGVIEHVGILSTNRTKDIDVSPTQCPATDFGIDTFKEDQNYYKLRLAHDILLLSEDHERMFQQISLQQANSVGRLTMLAAFFLPLSLAAAILSMQTRFVDLNMLLYDFVGVMTVLGTFAAVLSLLNQYSSTYVDKFIEHTYGFSMWMLNLASQRRGWSVTRTVKFIWLGIWWVALLISFIYGMLRDVQSALKILGYEVAGILFFWGISIILFREYGWSIKKRFVGHPRR